MASGFKMRRNIAAVFGAALALAAIGFVLCLSGCTSAPGGAETGNSANLPVDSEGSDQGEAGSSDSPNYEDSPFVGSWRMIEAAIGEDSHADADAIDAARERGLESCMVLYPDGSAAQEIYGANYYGGWTIIDEFEGALILDSLGICMITLDDSTLTVSLMDPDSESKEPLGTIVYERTEGLEIMPKDEYHAAVDAFAGTWHPVSASRDGVVITREAGEISDDISLELTREMRSNYWTGDEEPLEFGWVVTGSDSAVLGNPVDGTPMTLSDGLLVLEFAESDTVTFEKEQPADSEADDSQ